MNVSAYANQMRLALDWHRSKAAAEYRTVSTIPVVDPLREASSQESHSVRKESALAEEQEVEVVAEQTVSVHLKVEPRRTNGQAVEENHTVVVVAEHVAAIDAAIHHVLPSTLMILES